MTDSRSKISFALLFLVLVGGNTGYLLLGTNAGGRLVATVCLLLFLPGCLTLFALFPKREDYSLLGRLSLLLPCSLAIVGGITLLVNYFSTYDYSSAILIIAGINVGLVFVAIWRGARLDTTYLVNYLDTHRHFVRPTFWQAIFILSLVVFGVAFVYAFVSPQKPLALTEFYVLNDDKKLPYQVNQNEMPGSVFVIGITNHEGRSADYRVAISALSDGTETILWSGSVSVADNATQEEPVALEGLPPNARQLQFRLYLGNSQTPYRSLSLSVQ